jgi:hypothetical protein
MPTGQYPRKPRTEETKAKISAARKGKPFSGTPYDPTGTKHSEATKLKMRLSHLGEKAHNWNGGRSHTMQGYVTILINGKQRLEHRVVMEKIIGRPLKRSEDVHHLDGDKTNNNPKNLKLMLRAKHTKLHWKKKRLSKNN